MTSFNKGYCPRAAVRTFGRRTGLASGTFCKGSGRSEFPNACVLLSSSTTETRFISTAVLERSLMTSAAT